MINGLFQMRIVIPMNNIYKVVKSDDKFTIWLIMFTFDF
jgi:hypothetical protein